METDLVEKLTTFVSRCNVEAFMRDFDKRGARKILPSQAVRALSQAGLTLSAAEQAQVMAAYSGEDGMWSYDAFLSDGARRAASRRVLCAAPRAAHALTSLPPSPRAVNPVRRTGFFESNPTVDPAMTSPKARFKFRGAHLPTLFQPRATLSDAEEAALAGVFKTMQYETVLNRFVVATLMRPFDPVQRGSVTLSRFERVLMTHFPRLTAPDVALLAKAYAGGDGQVRYAALSHDVTPDEVDDGMPRAAPGGTPRAAPPPSPNVRLAQSLALGASEDEMREGYRVLLRTLHERRIRIADVFRDFALHSPMPGRITREQLVRGLSGVGIGAVTIDPRVIDGIAGMYSIASDPGWVDHVACIRDIEATTYLRHLETMDPGTLNETFSREVAMSPNPRFVPPTLAESDEKTLEKVLKELTARAARDRVFNVRIFAAQYDKMHNVRPRRPRRRRSRARGGPGRSPPPPPLPLLPLPSPSPSPPPPPPARAS